MSVQYRVVLDTNQIISAGTAWLDPAFLLRESISPDIELARNTLITVATYHVGLFSGKIVGEYTEKLIDLGHPQDRVAKLIAYLMGAFTRVEIVTQSAPICRADPDDEVFILCAIDGNADYLISEDKHLLDIQHAYSRPRIGRRTEIAPSLV